MGIRNIPSFLQAASFLTKPTNALFLKTLLTMSDSLLFNLLSFAAGAYLLYLWFSDTQEGGEEPNSEPKGKLREAHGQHYLRAYWQL